MGAFFDWDLGGLKGLEGCSILNFDYRNRVLLFTGLLLTNARNGWGQKS
jgi:hypothetical protein